MPSSFPTRWLQPGVSAALGSALLVGAAAPLAKLLLAQVSPWLLAALLHGPALAQDFDVATPAIPEVVATVAQVTAGLAGLATLVLFGLALLRRRTRPTFRALSRFDTPAFGVTLPSASFLLVSPRPPPIAK